MTLLKDIKEWKCEYCHSIYKNKRNLLHHQSTCKKCLVLQDNLKYQESKESDMKVNYELQMELYKKDVASQLKDYDEILARQDMLHEKQLVTQQKTHEKQLADQQKAHEKVLLERDERERKITEDFNNKIQNILMKLASKPTTTTNTTNINNKTLNMTVLNTDQDSFETFFKNEASEINNIEDLVDKLLIKFTDQSGNLQYICTDPSRNMFKFKDKNNVVQKDPNAVNLISIIQTPLNMSMKQKEYEMLKILGDYSYNNTHEQRDAEETYNSLYEMKNLSRKESNKAFCNTLSTKCSLRET
jgi:hypothetical protein